MSRKWNSDGSIVTYAMLQSQHDGWRSQGWTWNKRTDLISFSAGSVGLFFCCRFFVFIFFFSPIIFSPLHQPTYCVWDSDIAIHWCKQSCSGLRLIFGRPLISGLIAPCIHTVSGVVEISAGCRLESVCPYYANDMPISFSYLTSAPQTGHLVRKPPSL